MEGEHKKKNVVKITYKLIKKCNDPNHTGSQTTINIKKTISSKTISDKKQDIVDDDDDDEDEDDLPLIKINIKNKSSKVNNCKTITKSKQNKINAKNKKNTIVNNHASTLQKQLADVPLKQELEPAVKVKPSYCKICFIKTSNDEEALEHESCHNTFRKPDGRWTCIICSDEFPFYCDLLNHFLNHRDILELYSVYLSNLDTSLSVKKQDCYSDEESDDLDTEIKDEIFDFGDENKVESEKLVSEGSNEILEDVVNSVDKSADLKTVHNVVVVPKIEPIDDAYSDRDDYEHYDEPEVSELFNNLSNDIKLEADDFTSVKKEILDEDVYREESFFNNDSDEDKPLSSCVIKKVKKKKKKKKKLEKENMDNFSEEKKTKKLKQKKRLKVSEVYFPDYQEGEEEVVAKRRKRGSCEERRTIPYSKLYRMMKCDDCDYESSKKAELEAHSAEHVQGEPILCELCDFTCKIERQLARHKRIIHEGYKYTCVSCEFTSKTIANLKGHMVVHGDRKIGCNICGKMFRRKNNLNDHMKTHTDNRPFKCSECFKTFKDPKGYKLHLLGAHNIIQRLTCSYCDFETIHRDDLNMHKASLHHSLYMRLAPIKNDKGEIVDSIIYACNKCEYVATTEANLKSHLIVHNDKNISCEVCGKMFRRLGNLLEHQRSHSENRPFACPVCPAKAFKDNKSYRRHIARQHDMIEMIKCDICDYRTHTQGLMRFHAMKHSGQLRFKCNECSYACMTRNTMQRHKLVHKDVLPVYNCELCDFQSVSDRAVKRHKQVHAEK